MDQGCADLTFGLQPQALAIAHLLAGMVPDFADWDEESDRFDVEINTFPWYNGEEKCVCLLVWQRSRDHCLHIVFGEDRKTDALFVEHWEDERPPNCPTLESANKDAYEGASCNRELFEASEAGTVAERIFDLMAMFYADLDPKWVPIVTKGGQT